jgi:ribose 5-phosphate isomerase
MERMTPQDIVKTEVERTMPGTDWQTVYAQIHEMVKQPKHRIFRANNSLFIITNNGDHTVDFSMCNADALKDMPKSLKEFFSALKVCGFTEARFATSRPAMYRMVERAGYKPQVFPHSNAGGSKAKVTL